MAANMPMMATVIISSIKVNPREVGSFMAGPFKKV